MAYTTADLGGSLPLLASGKVRELYVVDSKKLLFVASDRISAYDVIMQNVEHTTFLMYYESSNSFEGRAEQRQSAYPHDRVLVQISPKANSRFENTLPQSGHPK